MVHDTSSWFSAEVFSNPYPFYQRLRANSPIYLDRELGCWIVTSYRDVVTGLANRSLSSERAQQTKVVDRPGWEDVSRGFSLLSQMLVYMDPPKHTQLRSLIARSLTPASIEQRRPWIQQQVDTLLDALEISLRDKGQVDFMEAFAIPLPLRVMADFVGIPYENCWRLKNWADDMFHFMDNVPTPQRGKRFVEGFQDLLQHFQEVGAVQRHQSKDDFLGVLVQARERGLLLSEAEIMINYLGFFSAGVTTTTHLIGNSLLALLRHPEQMRRLQTDPTLITSAVEEFLRYDAPIQALARLAKSATSLGEVTIPKGRSVILMLGAANRDPLQFADPDRLDISRKDNKHLSFGYSCHYCAGATLARLEVQIAINAILQRFPHLKAAPRPVEWERNIASHGPTKLFVLCGEQQEAP